MAIDQSKLNSILLRGNIQLPLFVVENYHNIGINNDEMIVLMQIIAYHQTGNVFPNTKMISHRTHLDAKTVDSVISSLIKKKIISLNQSNTEFILDGLFEKITDNKVNAEIASNTNDTTSNPYKQLVLEISNSFGRDLSPNELVMIDRWIKLDDYAPELISAAIDRSILNGKMTLNYANAILVNWRNSGVLTLTDVDLENIKFQSKQMGSQKKEDIETNDTLKIPDPKKPIS